MVTFLIIVSVVAFGAIVGTVYFAIRSMTAAKQIEDARRERLLLQDTQVRLSAERRQVESLAQEVERLRAEGQQKEEILDNLEKDIEHLNLELEKRPRVTRRVYRILTLGVSGTGKTALTLKWSNPLFDLGTLKGTKIERYERTVSHVINKDVTTEHVFEVGDWGGEHIVDALQEAITEEIHGMLIVVDLVGPTPPVEAGHPPRVTRTVEPERIQQQLREFQPEVLKFFFGPKTLASCQTVVLFINKSDVISGTPSEVERIACGHYEKLIKDIQRYSAQIDVRVLVGSAVSGHSTHHLFAHFVDRVLPKNAYDAQLLQRMIADPSQKEKTHVPRR